MSINSDRKWVITAALLWGLAFFLMFAIWVDSAVFGWNGGITPVQADREAVRGPSMQLTAPPAPPPTAPPTTLPAVPSWPWDALQQCESSYLGWTANTGNGYYGGLQFALTSWRAVGGTGYPHQHSREEQIRRGIRLQEIQGWGAWPACSRKLGLR